MRGFVRATFINSRAVVTHSGKCISLSLAHTLTQMYSLFETRAEIE